MSCLRSIEPPSHNKWEVERNEDPAYAKTIVQKLYAWIRDCVKKTSQEGCLEMECDFEGMQQYLPDDLEEEEAKPSDSEGMNTTPKDVEIIIRQPKKPLSPRHTSLARDLRAVTAKALNQRAGRSWGRWRKGV